MNVEPTKKLPAELVWLVLSCIFKEIHNYNVPYQLLQVKLGGDEWTVSYSTDGTHDRLEATIILDRRVGWYTDRDNSFVEQARYRVKDFLGDWEVPGFNKVKKDGAKTKTKVSV